MAASILGTYITLYVGRAFFILHIMGGEMEYYNNYIGSFDYVNILLKTSLNILNGYKF